MEKRGRELEPAPLLPWKTPSLNSTTSTNRDDLDNTHIHNNNISTVTTEDKGSMTRGLPGCRRRRKQQRSNSERIELISGNPTAPPRVMAPRSFEHQLYLTMARTGHRTAYLCRGVISCFVSRLDGISRFCAIYSLTGMLFTVRGNRGFSNEMEIVIPVHFSVGGRLDAESKIRFSICLCLTVSFISLTPIHIPLFN